MKTFFEIDSVRGKRPVVIDPAMALGGSQAPEEFSTAMVDPPWPYESGAEEAQVENDAQRHWIGRVSSEARYGAMSIQQLCDLGETLPIAKNAHLYLWYTNSFPAEACQIAKAWGFEQKTIITWVKTNVGTLKPTQGTGHYFPGNTEHMLFCVRGKLSVSKVIPPHQTTILAPRAGHSQKPAKAYRLVEDSSPGPWLEVFSRTARRGWFLYGDQIKPKSK